MRRFKIQLGNTAGRRGHRSDCAQVCVTFMVSASTKQAAIECLQTAHRDRSHYENTELVALDLASIELNFDSITERDVTEVAA